MGKGLPILGGDGSMTGSVPGAAAVSGDGHASPIEQAQQGLPESSEAPQALTLEAVQKLIADRDQQVLRQAQSLVDKSSGRLEKKFADLQAANQRALTVAKQTGMSPEALAQYEEALNRDALQKAMSAEPPSPTSPNGQPRELPQQGVVDSQAISAQGAQIAASFGLVTTDPEAKYVIRDGTPEEFIASIKIAGRMKQERLGAPGDIVSPQKAAARAPAVGVTGGRAEINPIKDISATGDLYSMAWEEVKKKHRGQ